MSMHSFSPSALNFVPKSFPAGFYPVSYTRVVQRVDNVSDNISKTLTQRSRDSVHAPASTRYMSKKGSQGIDESYDEKLKAAAGKHGITISSPTLGTRDPVEMTNTSIGSHDMDKYGAFQPADNIIEVTEKTNCSSSLSYNGKDFLPPIIGFKQLETIFESAEDHSEPMNRLIHKIKGVYPVKDSHQLAPYTAISNKYKHPLSAQQQAHQTNLDDVFVEDFATMQLDGASRQLSEDEYREFPIGQPLLTNGQEIYEENSEYARRIVCITMLPPSYDSTDLLNMVKVENGIILESKVTALRTGIVDFYKSRGAMNFIKKHPSGKLRFDAWDPELGNISWFGAVSLLQDAPEISSTLQMQIDQKGVTRVLRIEGRGGLVPEDKLWNISDYQAVLSDNIDGYMIESGRVFRERSSIAEIAELCFSSVSAALKSRLKFYADRKNFRNATFSFCKDP